MMAIQGCVKKRMMTGRLVCILLFSFLTLLVVSCNTRQHEESPERVSSGQSVTRAGHERMVRLLDSLGKVADPADNYHLNAQKASAIGARAQAEREPGKRIQLIFQYALQMLNAGKPDEAIKVLENLINGLGGIEKALQPATRTVVDILGVAYLRKGELENCVSNHNAFTCILPLQPEAEHQLRQGSEQAIRVFEAILRAYPDDLQTRYLLNLAATTLGAHPKGISEAWRMPITMPTEPGFPRFPNRAVDLGIDIEGIAGGCCMDDFSGDGRLDLMVSSYMYGDQIRYFRQTPNGQLIEETAKAGLTGITGGLNMKQADYDNDGYTDLLVLRGGWLGRGGRQPHSLIRNNGDGTFTDVTIQAGLLDFQPGQTAEWADFDGDGWLDLFVGYESGNFNDTEGETGVYSSTQTDSHPCRLYRNNADGTFSDVAPQLGLNLTGFVKGAAWGDFNNDRWPDLYVSILGAPNRLYMNRPDATTGGRIFEEIASQAGVAEPLESFPCWVGDVNNDGYTDVFVAGYDLDRLFQVGEAYARELLGLPALGAQCRLYLNSGDETFRDVSAEYGIDKSLFAMGLNAGDIDNDGWIDLMVGTGAPDLRSVVPNRVFRNNIGLRFEDYTSHGFGNIQKGHGISFGDIDEDGDQDIYAVIGGAYQGDYAQNVLYENPGIEGNSWITLRLKGTTSNRSAVGARLVLTVLRPDGSTRRIVRTVDNGASFGANSLQLETGLGDAREIVEVSISWPRPGAEEVKVENIPLNRIVTFIEGKEAEFLVEEPRPLPLTGSGHEGHHHHH